MTAPARPGQGDRTMAGPAGAAVRRVAALIIVMLLAATAGLAFHRVFDLGDLAPVVAVAAVVPVLLSAVASWPRRRGRPLWISVLLTVAGWTLLSGYTLFHGDVAAVGGALRDSWKGILTSLVPAPGRPELLVLPHVLIWLSGVAGAEIVLRTRAKAAPALPAVIVFGVAVPLGVGGPGSNGVAVAALVGLAGALVLTRGGRAAWPLAGIPVAVALGLVAAAVAPLLPMAGEPYDLRTAVRAPPPRQRDTVSPLDRVSAWLQSPDQQMFTVHASAPEDWRLAVLDRFDGITWTSGGRFVPAGRRIPSDDRVRRIRVSQRIVIQELDGVWVPAADRPYAIGGLGVTVDAGSAVLTAARPLRSGQAYTVASLVPEYDAQALADAEPAHDAEAQAAALLPESPGTTATDAQVPVFRTLAQRLTQDEDSGFQRAARIAEYLRTVARYDVTGLPGHTYAQLLYFLAHSKRGTSEQFATAFAVLARSIGLPTRVVVGFRPGVGGDGAWQVRSGDVLVWPEVDFAGLGWVPFFPTPEQRTQTTRSNGVPAGAAQQRLQAAQRNATSHRKATGSGRTARSPVVPPAKRPPAAASTPWQWYATAAVAATTLAYLLGVAGVPALRRRGRRARPTPSARITGAWEQTLEALGAVGLPPVTVLTTREVARFGAHQVGGADRHLLPLADLVDRSRYAAAAPVAAEADAAWRHADQVRRLTRRTARRTRRLARRLHPRSLRPR